MFVEFLFRSFCQLLFQEIESIFMSPTVIISQFSSEAWSILPIWSSIFLPGWDGFWYQQFLGTGIGGIQIDVKNV